MVISIAIDYIFIFEVIVIDIFAIAYQLQVPCCSGNFGICPEGFQSSLKNIACRKVPTAAQEL